MYISSKPARIIIAIPKSIKLLPNIIFFIMLFLHNFRFVAHFSYSNYTIKLVNISTATLDYMRKVRTVFCPDFLDQS